MSSRARIRCTREETVSLILTHCENDVLLPCLVLTRLNHPSLAYGRNQPPTGRTAQASENSGKTLRFLAKATEDTKVRTVRASLVVRKDGVSRQQKIALGHLSEFGEDQRKSQLNARFGESVAVSIPPSNNIDAFPLPTGTRSTPILHERPICTLFFRAPGADDLHQRQRVHHSLLPSG